jgi:hypothetical protein
VEFIIDGDADLPELLKRLGEVATLSIDEGILNRVLEAVEVMLDLGFICPVELADLLEESGGVVSCRPGLPQLPHVSKSLGITVGLVEMRSELGDKGFEVVK